MITLFLGSLVFVLVIFASFAATVFIKRGTTQKNAQDLEDAVYNNVDKIQRMLPNRIRVMLWYPVATLLICFFSPLYLLFVFLMWCCSGENGFNWLLWVVVKFGIPLYPVTQEDSRIERELLNIEGQRIVTICASGDRVLETMVGKPEQVTAVDLNPAQLALFDLKLASIKMLNYEDIEAIFFHLNAQVLKKHLPTLMKSFRSSESVKFWQKNGAAYINCLYTKGSSGKGWRMMQWLIEIFSGIDMSLLTEHPELVPELWKNEWREKVHSFLHYVWHIPFAWNALATPIRMALGVPPSQGSLRGCLMEHPIKVLLFMDRVFGSSAFQDNTEFLANMFGVWGKNKPYWLEKENIQIIKTQVNKCYLRKGYFTEVLRSLPDNTVDCFLLSDHMDWMSQNEILEEWNQILRVSGGVGEVMWRTAGLDEIAYPHCLATLTFANQIHLDEFLYTKDRYPSYRHHLIRLHEQNLMNFMPRENVEPYRSIWTDAVNIYHILNKGVRGKLSEWSGVGIDNWCEFFYSGQAKSYDSFRHMMLHGRYPLMTILPLRPKTVWADIGCGTGFNLEYLKDWIVTDDCEHIYLLDYSASMLAEARNRVQALGVAHKTTIVECDCSKPINIPKEITLATFSYSLCMIPNWEDAIKCVYDLLVPGGYLAATDFTLSESQSSFSRYFWKHWFRNDHVYLNEKHLLILKELVEPKVDVTHLGSLPGIPFEKVPYYYFLGQKTQLIEKFRLKGSKSINYQQKKLILFFN